jgi:hypothetical protein
MLKFRSLNILNTLNYKQMAFKFLSSQQQLEIIKYLCELCASAVKKGYR